MVGRTVGVPRGGSRRLAVPVILALLAAVMASCSIDEAALGQAASTTTSGSTTTRPTTSTTDSATSLVEPADARALITPTGVIVPVLGVELPGYRVTAPCGDELLVSAGTPIAEADVVLDPGHGGEVETGAVGANGLIEKDLNLRLARRTALELKRRRYSVVLTRTGDYRVPLEVRGAIANRLDASVFVSIHHNAPAPPGSDRPGT